MSLDPSIVILGKINISFFKSILQNIYHSLTHTQKKNYMYAMKLFFFNPLQCVAILQLFYHHIPLLNVIIFDLLVRGWDNLRHVKLSKRTISVLLHHTGSYIQMMSYKITSPPFFYGEKPVLLWCLHFAAVFMI